MLSELYGRRFIIGNQASHVVRKSPSVAISVGAHQVDDRSSRFPTPNCKDFINGILPFKVATWTPAMHVVYPMVLMQRGELPLEYSDRVRNSLQSLAREPEGSIAHMDM